MVEGDGKARRAAARPLLAYGPEFLEPVSLSRVSHNDEEREHQRRREELLRRKQELLDAGQNGKLDPKADMLGRMNAVREALQANLDGEAVKSQPAPETSKEPENEPAKLPRRRRRWGPLAGFRSEERRGGKGGRWERWAV